MRPTDLAGIVLLALVTAACTGSGGGGTAGGGGVPSTGAPGGSGGTLDAGSSITGWFLDVKGTEDDYSLTLGCQGMHVPGVHAGPAAELVSGGLNVVVISACSSPASLPRISMRLGNGVTPPSDIVMPGASYMVGSGALSPLIQLEDADGRTWTAESGTLEFTGLDSSAVIGNYEVTVRLPEDAGPPGLKTVGGDFRLHRGDVSVP